MDPSSHALHSDPVEVEEADLSSSDDEQPPASDHFLLDHNPSDTNRTSPPPPPVPSDPDSSYHHHFNGDASEDDPHLKAKRRASSSRVVIPDELRGNTDFFRRSRRERTRPDRLSISPNHSPSDHEPGDSDFNAEEEMEDEYEEEFEDDPDDDDDDDYGVRPSRKRKPGSTRSKSSRSKRQRVSLKLSDAEEPILDDPPPESESDSDGDWLNEGQKKRPRPHHRRSASAPSKRRRLETSPEDEQVARTARINSRTNTSINYFEGDDDPFDSADEAALKAQEEEQEIDSKTPRIETVLEYRLIEGTEPRIKNDKPFADFHQNDVQFRIQWTNKSVRHATWETWEALKYQKGAKRVSNWITKVNKSREFCQTVATREEIAEMHIFLAEHRVATKKKEVAQRVIAQRDTEIDAQLQTEFLVKWCDVSYDGCTWEGRSRLLLEADQKLVDEFTDREQAVLNTSGKKMLNPFNSKDHRPKFKRMSEQPSFLHGDGRTLRDYQLAGLNFLAFSWTKRNNVILADEMGLGKTVQTISFIAWLMYFRNVQGPYMVVVPLSTIAAWVREFTRWVPDINVVCYSGNAKARATIREHELFSANKRTVEKFDVLLTTPELLMQDQTHLEQFRFAIIAVDEAHRLKNETSALHITLANLRSANRLLVTGTPLQNSVRELWALLHFLNPNLFPNAETFEQTFSFTALRDPERVTNLHDTLRPFIIRRQKVDVEKSLPKKTYNVLRVAMTGAQQQYYRWLLTKNVTMLNAASKARSGNGNAVSIRNLLMELKKCCNHLFLFEDYEDTSTPTSVNDLINASGKMILLDKLLIRLKQKGHRVLIFSQMVRMLDILQDYCRMRNFPFQRLDGTCSNEARQRAVDHFNAPDSIDYIFLLSTRAGGLGINLATADTVIIFDSDWNPQNDLQAESRAHRIGQKRDVKVFRLLGRETVEEDILERAKRKRVLEHVVIHGVEGGNKSEGPGENAFKKEELSAILRFGAEKLFAKEKLEEAQGGVETEADGTGNDSEKPKLENGVKSEDRRVLDADDIDELLNREATDETSQVGGEQPSIGDSLLNAFKWNDFCFEEEGEEDKGLDKEEENKKRAAEASSRMIAMDNEVTRAKKREEEEDEKHAEEGDSQFWDRVIPEHMRQNSIAADGVLGTRRRKRTKTFGAESPRAEKRRRTRATVTVNGKVADQYELTEPERRRLLRSFRKFGDPNMSGIIVKDAGLEERIDPELALSVFQECIEFAKTAITDVKRIREGKSKEGDDYDDDPPYDSYGETKANGKESKGKQARIPIDILGEKRVDAVEFLKRCEDLRMIRNQVGSFDSDVQFRLRRVIKAPTYNVRWKPQNDAMLLVGICRHGLGNWTQIALDKQLHLADKMHVAGNPDSKPGAPDTTKLQRRVFTLLRELERDSKQQAKVNSRKPRSKERTTKKKSSKKSTSGKVDKRIAKRSGKGRRSSNSGKKKGRRGTSNGEEDMTQVRLVLKKANLQTLRELRSLSVQNNQLDSTEKIKRTKQCLIKLGDAIESQAEERKQRGGSSRKDPGDTVRTALWCYVHEVCKTSLEGDRLQQIFGKLSQARAPADEASS